MTSMTVYSWLLYAMFMFHPENNVAWRITDQLRFNSFVDCEKFYRENTDQLIAGLRDHMVANFGPVDKGEYTLMELGCVPRSVDGPVVTRRAPLSSVDTIKGFITNKIDV